MDKTRSKRLNAIPNVFAGMGLKINVNKVNESKYESSPNGNRKTLVETQLRQNRDIL